MRLHELVEARVEPDKKFMSQVEQIIETDLRDPRSIR